MLRQGNGSPLVLLHGILCSERVWRHVVPLVAPHHDTLVPTALGHRGGSRLAERPASVRHVVDDVERLLDEQRIDKAHLAGNSLGGWVALELARRGRARSVCALSPAGFWSESTGRSDGTVARLRATMRDTRFGRPFLPLLGRSSGFRRWAMRLNAVHGDRITPSEFVGLADDLLGCTAAGDLLRTTEALGRLHPLPCPITIAWSEKDRVLPLSVHGATARERVPGARFLVLSGLGHVPMFDAPDVVARTVLESTGAASARLAGESLPGEAATSA
jgi:pimeloyl-ACP methyl ester carboxylesterase